jgi:HK97 gp10 family phage protein
MASIDAARLASLRLNLSQFSTKLAGKVLRSSLRRGTNIVRDQARANFGVDGGPDSVTGALRASIRVAARRGSPTRIAFSVVAGDLTASQQKRFGAAAAFYAVMVEKGHINRKAGQALRGSKAGVQAARAASTNNTPARPFMRPAIDEKREAVIDYVAGDVRSRIKEAIV